MSSFILNTINRIIEWLTRPRNVGLRLIGFGVAFWLAVFSLGYALDVSLPIQDGRFDLKLDSGSGTPAILIYAAAIIGTVLVLAGLVTLFVDHRRLSKRKIIIVEMRGLRDGPSVPLTGAFSSMGGARVDPLLIDIRQTVDGVISSPETAVARINSVPNEIRSRTDGLDRNDLELVYGGLAPVPFTFLLGMLIDDENNVTALDWDRSAQQWRRLDALDDGNRFSVSGLKELQDTTEVALAISASYPIDLNQVRKQFPQLPVVEMGLIGRSIDAHWSAEKQAALSKQFLELAIALSGQGIQKIHLFLAGPSSLVFNLGRSYDKRNLPSLLVYQYEKSEPKSYPWGIKMPRSGEVAQVLKS